MRFNNTPEDLSINDFFDHKDKAISIISLLKENMEGFEKNKMIALYGEWGSGKTSMMRFIQSDLLQDSDYFPIFFEAWRHERDTDISASLLELITESAGNKLTAKKFLRTILSGMKTFGKGIGFKSELLGVEIDIEKIIEEEEEKLKKLKKEISFHGKNKLFQENFKEVEKAILSQNQKKKIIVFIDDLDRCEPENIITLLSTIKLFFTMGESTIFFFGIDKKAIQKAVYSKYGDIIKSEEYLEKIFDFSFKIPNSQRSLPLIESYFTNCEPRIPHILNNFFRRIKFTNPRHLKKVLNKYDMLVKLKKASNLPGNLKDITPNVIHDGLGDLAETIFTFYFIILSEFYPDKLNDLFDVRTKHLNYGNALMERSKAINSSTTIEGSLASIKLISPTGPFTIPELINEGTTNNGRATCERLLMVFTPSQIEHFSPEVYNNNLLSFFDSEKFPLEIGFCEFLFENLKLFKESKSDYLFRNFQQMAIKLL